MDFLNKIELRGVVGSVHAMKVGDTEVVRFSVMTEYAYNDKSGAAVVDCTWFNCTAWADKTPSAVNMEKGDCVHLSGRVRMWKFTGSDGKEVNGWEVMVNDLKILGK